jgi:Ca2+/Na+ antiporter
MGNAAPDMFGVVSSFTSGEDQLIGFGALLGASVFASTVVVGSVAIASNCKVSRPKFIRDIVYHLLSITTVGITGLVKHVNIFVPLFLLVFYGFYVYLVVRGVFNDDPDEAQEAESRGFQMTGLQTAFWHGSTNSTSKESISSVQIQSKMSSFPISIKYQAQESKKEDSSSAVSGYKFLILKEGDSSDGDDSDDDGETTINLSGGLITPEFSGVIYEDYFAPKDVPPSSPVVSLDNTLSDSLIERQQTSVMNTFYWKNIQLRRRLQRKLFTSQWASYPWYFKLLSILESPFTLVGRLLNYNKLSLICLPIKIYYH